MPSVTKFLTSSYHSHNTTIYYNTSSCWRL